MATISEDAAALYTASTAFIRVYQFRDRDQALRFGLTVVQAYALDLLLEGEGLGLTALAESLRIDKSTASRVVAGMERNRLVEWSRPAHDLRAKLIVASREGKRRYQRLRASITRANAQLLQAYSPTERRAVISALERLTRQASR